jgi:hypothetical protein
MFVENLSKVKKEALQFINDALKKQKLIHLLDQEIINHFLEGEASDEENELLDSLPSTFIVGRHGDYCQYQIVSISLDESGINFNGLGYGEESGNEYTFTLDELNAYDICFIADLLQSNN